MYAVLAVYAAFLNRSVHWVDTLWVQNALCLQPLGPLWGTSSRPSTADERQQAVCNRTIGWHYLGFPVGVPSGVPPLSPQTANERSARTNTATLTFLCLDF